MKFYRGCIIGIGLEVLLIALAVALAAGVVWLGVALRAIGG